MRVWVIGGGPSAAGFPFEMLRDQTCIAVNAAYVDVPWAQFLVFSDQRFYDWNREKPEWKAFKGRKITTWSHRALPDCEVWSGMKGGTRSLRIGFLGGKDSGTKAVNLAELIGARQIDLLGFDMKPNGNYHDRHELKNRQNSYPDFVRVFEEMGREILRAGVSVTNWCADSGALVYNRRDWRNEFIPGTRAVDTAA